MNRRHFLASLGAVAAGAVATAAGARSAHAKIACGARDGWGRRACRVGVASEVAHATASRVGPQQMSQWCWAACIEMVFAYHGFAVSQRRIVAETMGGIVDAPGSGWQILRNLNRAWVDDRGRRFRSSGDMASATPAAAARDLAADQPLIVGTMGHAMVLTALSYERDARGGGRVLEAVVRDPWPGSGRRTLSADEWYGVMFLARVRVSGAV